MVKTDNISWLNAILTYFRGQLQTYLINVFEATLIIDNLYLGSFSSALNHSELKQHGITHILSLVNVCPAYPDDFIYEVLPYRDSDDEDLSTHLTQSLSFIREGIHNGKVLVHCFYGKSRSSSIVIAYLMTELGYSYQDSYQIVKTLRPLIEPNDNFAAQLHMLESYKMDICKSWSKLDKIDMTKFPVNDRYYNHEWFVNNILWKICSKCCLPIHSSQLFLKNGLNYHGYCYHNILEYNPV